MSDAVKERIKEHAQLAVIGLKRMIITVCCIVSITVIDLVHVCRDVNMEWGTIVVVGAITALGGVDLIKNGLIKKPV